MLLFYCPIFLLAAPKKDAIPHVDPTFIYNTTVKVQRGGTREVTLRAISPQGYEVEFKLLSDPLAGTLSGPRRVSVDSVSYTYTHNGKRGAAQDSFRFKCKAGPHKAWSSADVTILVVEPPPRFAADFDTLDFGSVFIGANRTLPLRIKNVGGSQLRGCLKVAAPWTVSEPDEFVLAEGESKKIQVTFAPFSTDSQRGRLVFQTSSKPFPEIILEGSGKNRFTAPDKVSFEQRIGARELRIPVQNHTAAGVTISIHSPPPLEAPATLDLAPESTTDLVLTLPPRPFAEKSVLVTLGDDAAVQDIQIQLPPPPSRVEWKIVGKNQLGLVSPGQIKQLEATLRNTGSAEARVTLRAEGNGFSLLPGQPNVFDIPPDAEISIQAECKIPQSSGPLQATLIAETDGLPPVRASWDAEVVFPPLLSPAPDSTPIPAPLQPQQLTQLQQLTPDMPFVKEVFVVENGSNQMTIKWLRNPEVSRYILERREIDPSQGGFKFVEWQTPHIEFLDEWAIARFRKLPANTFWFFRISGVDQVGNIIVPPELSFRLETLPPKPLIPLWGWGIIAVFVGWVFWRVLNSRIKITFFLS